MFETLEKLTMASLGALTMTREKAEQIFDEYVKRGQMEKESRSGFVKEVMDNAEKARNDLEKLVSEQVKKTINSLELATKEDIARIEQKIDRLNRKDS